jgi:hypothetical protein
MKEIIQNQLDYPLSDADPSNGEFERFLKGEITRKAYCSIYPVTFENYDLFHYSLSGGPGYGDPLERKVESVKKDLDDDLYTKDIVNNVYGVVAKYNEEKTEWIIDFEATKKRRDELLKERSQKSKNFEEFWEYEKKKIVEGQLSEPAARMYSESIQLSKRWAKEFREFWKLPDSFITEVK